jgi:hypothetical protein
MHRGTKKKRSCPPAGNILFGVAIGVFLLGYGYHLGSINRQDVLLSHLLHEKVVSHVVNDKPQQLTTQQVGWSNLHVYYGLTDQLEIIKPFSQVKQDEYVASMLSYKQGYFVDLAANDATLLSNTYTLERDYAWTGGMYTPVH